MESERTRREEGRKEGEEGWREGSFKAARNLSRDDI